MPIELRLSTGGLAFASRMRPGGVRHRQVQVSLDRQRVRIQDFPRPGAVATYDEGSVRIDGPSGSAAACRRDGGPASSTLHWDHLDLAYFVGYALWNYIAIPAMLWQLPHRELSRNGGCRRVEVHFPPEIITHCPVQTFYVDDDGRILRHDYVAEVFGGWARAAHFGHDHVHVGNQWIATRRRVVPRTHRGRALPGPTLVWIALDDLGLSASRP